MDTSVVTTTLAPTVTDQDEMNSEAIGGIALAVWILFSNLTLITAILRSEHRRTVSFNLHVCNLALSSLLMGGFVLPLFADFNMRQWWPHSNNVCRMWLMGDMMVCTVAVLVIAAMMFDRFVLFSCAYLAEGGCKFVLSAVLIVLPWILASGFVIPIYLFGETGDGVNEDTGRCYLHLQKIFAILSEIVGYAVPSLVAFALLVATSLTWCVKREELRDMDFSDEREHKGWQVFTSWIICLSVIGMWFPFFALHTLTHLLDKAFPTDWYKASIWLAYANSGITPILWMIMPRLRQSVRNLCCCCCRKRDDEDGYLDDETSAAMIEFHEKN